ncbi:MAG: hypothetical protein HN509_17665 [Halobacteriovoraceae bacterium]|jgi:hypothetical protein|nr:hypothetical protein [Halobacteriovoraceae bacterium]MBT5094667.1 hypothetical protein [Halobacteriovoraceae bacterium]
MKIFLTTVLLSLSFSAIALDLGKIPTNKSYPGVKEDPIKVPNFKERKGTEDVDLISTNTFRWSLEENSPCTVKVTNVHTEVSFTDSTLCESVKTRRL